MSIRYLSSEWLAAANEAVAKLEPTPDDVGVGYQVIGTPDGDIGYTVVLGPDEVGFAEGTELAGVTLTLEWELARKIFHGTASAQRAFLDGSIRVGGDVQLLVGNNDAMAAIDAELAQLRSQTT